MCEHPHKGPNKSCTSINIGSHPSNKLCSFCRVLQTRRLWIQTLLCKCRWQTMKSSRTAKKKKKRTMKSQTHKQPGKVVPLQLKMRTNVRTPCSYVDRIITGSDLLTLRRSCVRRRLQPTAPPTPDCLTSQESAQGRCVCPCSPSPDSSWALGGQQLK